MTDLATVAPAFVEMAHRIVWCTVATTGGDGAPNTRVLHPIWEWDGERLTGWIGTGQTPVKRADIAHSPYVSLTYLNAEHDTATADCEARWFTDDETCAWLWERFKTAPAPVGYDPAIVPPWSDGPTGEAFMALRLDPWRLRVMPGTVMLRGQGEVLEWRS